MLDKYLLGIDVGTTGTKSVLFKTDGTALARGYVEYETTVPKLGWAEQNPEIWWNATSDSIKKVISKAGILSSNISGIGLSGQTNGVVCLNNNNDLLRSCIIWMDQRSVKEANLIEEKIGLKKFQTTTGVLIDPFFSICKILWIKNNEPEIFKKTNIILQPKDYIGFRLTGRKVLDVALASCTGLLDTHTKKYAKRLLEILEIPIEKFPELVSPEEIIGELTKNSSKELNLSYGTPVVAGSGDVMVNAVGSGVVNIKQAYAKIATVSDIAAITDKPVLDPKFRFATYVHPSLDKWILMGGTTGGGICYRWFRDNFGQLEKIVSKNLAEDPYEIMNQEANLAEPGCRGLIFLPYLSGVRSPIWDPKAKGVYFGIKLEHKKNHFIRAILEGIAYSMHNRIDIMERDLGIQIRDINIVGGGGRSTTWRQIIADVTGKRVFLMKGQEHECLGAAILAGVGTKEYKDLQNAVEKAISVEDENEPNMATHEKYLKLYQIYVNLYDKFKSSFQQLSKIVD